MDALLRDIGFAVKLLLKDRGFTITTILTLSVCIGANASIFTIVNAVLLRPLPVPESGRIMVMSNQYPNAGVGRGSYSGVPDYYDRLRDVSVYEEQALFNNASHTIEINGMPERVRGMNATPSLFRLLRVSPLIGRSFNDEEGEPGRNQKVMLSHGLWQELYGGDPGAIGRELRLSGRPFTIIGVMPRNFLFVIPDARFWIPFAFSARQKSDDSRHSNSFLNIGRLKPGSTLQQAQAQIDALNAANLERLPKFKQLLLNAGFHTIVEPLQEMLVRPVKGTLCLLWGGAAFVLLIGAVNIANLVLARSSLRSRELVTRMALGASRLRVARQLVTESVIVTVAGGVAGIGLGAGILRALVAIGLNEIPRAGEVHIDAAVVVFTLALSVLVGVLIGIVPIGTVMKADLHRVLREEGRGGTGGRAARAVRRALVVAQVAFAFVLLIGAGLLFASFQRLLSVDPGFRSEGVITASTNIPASRYADDKDVRSFMARAIVAVRSVPGVMAAGATTTIPFGGSYNDSVILAEGYQMQPGESLVSPRQSTVTPGYFEAMNIALIRGRYFEDRDANGAQPAVIVDERLAKKFWPDQDPIGRRMYLPDNPEDLLRVNEKTRWLHVVGVVHEVRLEDLDGSGNNAGAYYFAWDQAPRRGGTFAIKTNGDTAAVLKAVRAEIAKIDPELPLYEVGTMDERTNSSLLPRRASMMLALAFGGVALFLSAIGIYGVLAYIVAQRTREIGIRMALGGGAGEIFRLVLREGMWLVAAGFVIGVAGTVSLRHAVESQIYGVRPMEPVVMGSVALVLGAVGVAACVLPARRATRVDPVSILNS